MRTIVLSGLLAVCLAGLGCSGGAPPSAESPEGGAEAAPEGGEAPDADGGEEGSAANPCEGLDQKTCGITMGCAWSMDTPAAEAAEGEEAAEPAAPSGSCVGEKQGGM